jgi:hypothetical protein
VFLGGGKDGGAVWMISGTTQRYCVVVGAAFPVHAKIGNMFVQRYPVRDFAGMDANAHRRSVDETSGCRGGLGERASAGIERRDKDTVYRETTSHDRAGVRILPAG